MNFKEKMKGNRMVFIATVAYLAVLFFDWNIFIQALKETMTYLREMLMILPAVLIVTGLIEVWVSKETILENFGTGAGLRGKLVSVFIGSISAGPIYAAFPVSRTLLKKGASIANVVVILSAWAVVKIPMLIVESQFLGIRFMGARYILTVPGIILIGVVTERLLNRNKVISAGQNLEDELTLKIRKSLPGYNCGSCGYESCSECAKAIAEGEEDPKVCVPGEEEVEKEITELIQKPEPAEL